MDKFVLFVKKYPAGALLAASAILTGLIMTDAFASVIVHIINLAVLGYIYHSFKNNDIFYTGGSILLSMGLTATMMHPSWISASVVILNGVLMFCAWHFAASET